MTNIKINKSDLDNAIKKLHNYSLNKMNNFADITINDTTNQAKKYKFRDDGLSNPNSWLKKKLRNGMIIEPIGALNKDVLRQNAEGSDKAGKLFSYNELKNKPYLLQWAETKFNDKLWEIMQNNPNKKILRIRRPGEGGYPEPLGNTNRNFLNIGYKRALKKQKLFEVNK